MELIVRGRGTRITDHLRQAADRKLGRLVRLEPSVLRLEVEVVDQKNPRLGGAHRLEVAFETPRRTFRATAQATDVEAALDLVVAKLDRQIRDHREKRRARLLAGAGRVKSARAMTELPGGPRGQVPGQAGPGSRRRPERGD
jgi:ribosomal subunit interface protein